MAVVAYRGGRLNCMCTEPWDGHAPGRLVAVVAYSNGQLYCSHGTGKPQDVWWSSSPIGVVGCSGCALSNETGVPEDIRWPSSPTEVVGCTACALTHRTGGPEDVWWPSHL